MNETVEVNELDETTKKEKRFLSYNLEFLEYFTLIVGILTFVFYFVVCHKVFLDALWYALVLSSALYPFFVCTGSILISVVGVLIVCFLGEMLLGQTIMELIWMVFIVGMLIYYAKNILCMLVCLFFGTRIDDGDYV